MTGESTMHVTFYLLPAHRFIHQSFVILGDTSTHFQNMDCLSTGQSFLPEAYDPVIKLMDDVIVNVNSDAQESDIDLFKRSPSSCHYFKNSIEGVHPN